MRSFSLIDVTDADANLIGWYVLNERLYDEFAKLARRTCDDDHGQSPLETVSIVTRKEYH